MSEKPQKNYLIEIKHKLLYNNTLNFIFNLKKTLHFKRIYLCIREISFIYNYNSIIDITTGRLLSTEVNISSKFQLCNESYLTLRKYIKQVFL